MKHLAAILLGLVCAIGIYFFVQYYSQPLSFSNKQPVMTPVPTIPIIQGAYQKLLFVPYWGLNNKEIPSGYDQIIYFGITPDGQGIDTQEDGYKELGAFVNETDPKSKKLLTVTMIQSDIDAKVLQDTKLQQKIITQSIAIAQQYGFSGIVLDFEYDALAFDSVVNNITSFSTSFALLAKQNSLSFYQAVYGDTFFRLRPFDVGNIAKNANGIIVLAYDFHKADGDPGPNFPLTGTQSEGYDLKTMVSDFEKKVPSQKLIIAFGLFGYDWRIDAKGHTTGPAAPLSLVQVQQKFLTGCDYAHCVDKRDPLSAESEVTYKDIGQYKHIVWFEDLQSIQTKAAYLKTKGINATALWAYSYF